jgi:dTDP-4-dehydrorhamnose reductase
MKIVIFGSSGQVGQELMCQSPDYIELLSPGSDQVDISDENAVSNLITQESPDVVVNAAAYTAVDAAEGNRDTAFRTNTLGPGVIARACEASGCLMVHVSTDYVFDGALDRAFNEEDQTNPLGVYGQSKLDGEQAVLASCSRYYIVRTAWVYSAHGKNFVKTMLNLGQDRQELSVVSDQFGGPTSAGDLAGAIYNMIGRHSELQDEARSEGRAYGIYHYCGNERISWYDFATEIFQQTEGRFPLEVTVNPINTVEYPTPAKRPKNSFLDCSKIEAFAGISCPDWRDSLRVVIRQIYDKP